MEINYNTYLDVCKLAADNDNVFKTFKRHPEYTGMLEHVTYHQGIEYLEYIKNNAPCFLELMDRFVQNDRIGNPLTFWYEDINMNISPTTLRYIKVLVDLVDNFEMLTGLDIVEIGCGYGGQCAIIHDYAQPKSYTLFDLPGVLTLSEKFLKERGVDLVILKTPDEKSDRDYDLCISNYAFTEFSREYQNLYVENVISRSEMGYITCNYFGQREDSGAMSKDEVMALKPNHKVILEIPLTAPNNLIYTWQK